MTHPLTFDFALISPLSSRPPHAVAREEMLAEVEQELADRRALYPRLVAKGALTPADAARHIEILAAIAADLGGGAGGPMHGGGYGWDAKVRELRREIEIRRNAWPRRVAKPGDPLDQPTAARRSERLDAVHFLYWIELFQFAPGQGFEEDPAAILDRVRAQVWRVEAWERSCLACPERSRGVRPRMIPWYQALDRGEAEAVRIWQTLEAAAARHGFVEERQAA